MSDLRFIPGRFDGMKSDDLSMDKVVYLCIDVAHDDSSISHFAGWVRPEVAALVKTAPRLLRALKRIKNEHRILGDEQLIAWVQQEIDAAEASFRS